MEFRSFPHACPFLLVLITVLVAPSYVLSRSGAEWNKTELQRFYVVSQRFSDGAPHFFDFIFDVRQDGTDVFVRAIRIAPENEVCDRVEVKALEKRVAEASVMEWVFRGADGSLTEPVSAVLNFSLGCEDAPPRQHSR